MGKQYLTISQYAEFKGITKQAVYKRLNNSLKKYLIEIDNQKFIDFSAFGEEEINEVENFLNNKNQPFNQPFNNEIQPFFEKQLEEKDKTISKLLEQVDKLQEQNSRLIDTLNNNQKLLENTQLLLAASEKKQLMEAENQKEKKGIFKLFKKNK